MKKWAVIYPYQEGQTSGKVVSTYYSEEVNYSRFGGPWGDKNKSLHLEIPESLHNISISDLEAKMVNKMVDCTSTPVVVSGASKVKKAYDSEGNPILDSSGNHLEVPEYTYDHVYEPQLSICIKD